MALYAVLENGAGSNVLKLYSPPDGTSLVPGILTAAEVAAAVLVTSGTPVVGTPLPVAVTQATATAAQQAQILLTGGLVISSSVNNWSGVFSTMTDSFGNSVWTMLLSEQDALNDSDNTKFADGSAVLHWPDVNGVLYTLTPAQFVPFKGAVGQFVAQCRNVITGVPGATLPSNSVNIDPPVTPATPTPTPTPAPTPTPSS